jgi:hypothetical protein
MIAALTAACLSRECCIIVGLFRARSLAVEGFMDKSSFAFGLWNYGASRSDEGRPSGKRKRAVETEFRFLTEDYAGQFLDFDAPSAAEGAATARNCLKIPFILGSW